MVVIKKYPNRRLYDTSTSSYITLEDIRIMLKQGDDIQVIDAQSKEDITQHTLIQILIEQEESSVQKMFSPEVLKSFIKIYGGMHQNTFGKILENQVEQFNQMQGLYKKHFKNTQDTMNQEAFFKYWSELQAQQMQAFQLQMKMLNETQPLNPMSFWLEQVSKAFDNKNK